MHTNYHFLVQVAAELKNRLVGLKVGECFTQERNQLIVGFYQGADEFFMKVNASRDFSGMAFYDEFPRKKINTADLFEASLNLQVLDVRIMPWSRGILIYLEQGFCIAVKLFGVFSNVLLFNKNNCAEMLNGNLQTDKELTLESLSLETPQSEDPLEWNTLGKVLQSELQKLKGMPERQFFMRQLEKRNPAIEKVGEVPFLTLLDSQSESYSDPLDASTQFLHQFLSWKRKTQLKSGLLGRLKKDIKKTKGYIKKNELAYHNLKNKSSYRELADVMMANLHMEIKGEEIELFDFYRNRNVVVKLKRGCSLQQQAQKYYQKGKSFSKQIDVLEANLEAAKHKLLRFETEYSLIDSLNDLKELKLHEKQSVKSKKEVFPFKEYNCLGYKIWVGKNAKNNDLLTLKYAVKQDYWLHAKDVAGSHVVIKDQAGKVLPEPVKLYAAGLAAAFSKRSTDSLVPVIITRKKFVRKPKGLPAGAVHVDKEEVILIEPIKK